MSCFDDIIGIGGCDEGTPSSGYYLRDAGVSIDELNMFAGVEYESGQDLAEKKITFATKIITNNIYTKFKERFIAKSFLENQRLGFFQENKSLKTSAAEWRGVELELKNTDNYIDVYIDKIEFFSNYTGNVSVVVKDVIQNKTLDTFVVAAIAGEIVSKTIDTTYKSEKKKLHLFVGYNATGIDVYNTQLVDGGCSGCTQGAYVSCNNWLRSRAVYSESSTVLEENLKGLSHTGGLSLVYSMKCNHEDWLCNYRNDIALVVCYKACEEIMNYAMNQTSRTNNKTIDRDFLGERMIHYSNKYHESFENLIGNINTPKDNNCFVCNEKIKSRVMTP